MHRANTGEKAETQPRRVGLVAKATAAVGAASLVSMFLSGCSSGSVGNSEAMQAASSSSQGQGLHADGYELVDINGNTLNENMLNVSFLAHPFYNVEFLGYRRCGKTPVSVCVKRPLKPGEIEPVLAVWPAAQGTGDVVGFAGAITANEAIGIGSSSVAASLSTDTGLARIEADLAIAQHPGSGQQLRDDDYALGI
jgi:hypothetical protein